MGGRIVAQSATDKVPGTSRDRFRDPILDLDLDLDPKGGQELSILYLSYRFVFVAVITQFFSNLYICIGNGLYIIIYIVITSQSQSQSHT